MTFNDTTLNQTAEVKYLDTYYPYWIRNEYGDRIRNPKFDNFSGQVLDLKNGKPEAIDYFFDLINPEINGNVAIAYVPSHDPEKVDSGIRKLAQKLAAVNNRIDATSCLTRHTKIEKLTAGGNREKIIHHNSISVSNLHLIKDKYILLIDDVTTTNNSLFACQEILLTCNVKSVQCLAIGQTEGY